MYSRYTTLQRAQLAKQEYLDTQDVFLAVYAPGRRASLEASLRDQLHQKFRLVDSLADALTPPVARGVVGGGGVNNGRLLTAAHKCQDF